MGKTWTITVELSKRRFIGAVLAILLWIIPAKARADNIFVTNNENGTVGEYTTSGATVNPALITGLSAPSGIVVSDGYIYVPDFDTGTIAKYTTEGTLVTASLVTGLAGPVGLRLFQGNLYVTEQVDGMNGRVSVYTTSGATVNAALIPRFPVPVDLAFDDTFLYVTSLSAGRVSKFDCSTGATVVASLIGGQSAPRGILQHDGFLYVANSTGGSVRKYTTSGSFIGSFTGFNNPSGIALSPSGTLLITNFAADRVSEHTTSGTPINTSLITGLSNPVGIAVGPVATPTPSAGALGNISTRLRVETGDNILIAGFILTGSQPKKVIARGIGPSLPVQDALANPILELRDAAGTLLGFNNNWKDNQRTEIEMTTIPPTNDLESAIVATLPANKSSYTAILRGAGGGTGTGVVELYDLERTVDSTLANLSTRGYVQTGNDVLIAGTIVVGSSPRRVIVRAIGPSLDLPDKMQDPNLELRDANGALLRENDNWRTDQEADIIATTIAPSHDLEAAIVATLPAQNASYTAILRGAQNTVGIAVVEVFAIN